MTSFGSTEERQRFCEVKVWSVTELKVAVVVTTLTVMQLKAAWR